MHKTCLISILILFALTSSSQNVLLIDSLTKESRIQSNDSIRARRYSDLNYQWAEYNFDSAWHYANKTLRLGRKLNDPILIALGMRGQGLAFDYQNQFDSAIYYYSKAADFSKENGDANGHASAVFNLGVVHSFKGEMEEAIENYQMATKVFEELGNDRMIGIGLNNMGIIYRKTGKYELAKEAYIKSLKVKEKRKDENGVLNTLTNISTVYRFLEQYDSAIIVSNRAISLAKKLKNETAYLHEIVNLAFAYQQSDNIDAANELYLEAEDLLNEKTPYETKAQVLNALGKFYYEKNELSKSQNYLKRLEDDLDEETKPEIAFEFYNLSHLVHADLGNSEKALSFLRLAMRKKGELLDNEVLSKTTELEQLYEKEKREAEIAQLNAENELQSVELERKRKEQIALIAGVVLVIIIASLLFVLFSQKKKSLAERDVLLKEIHHRVKNNLQVISSLLNLQADSLDDDTAKDAVKEGQHRVKSMALIHQKLYSADDVRGVNVQGYLEQLSTELFKAFGVDEERVRWKIDTSGLKMDIDTVIPLGLIINELITNSIKYAFKNADNGLLEISIKEEGDSLNVFVKDNGAGMDEEAMKTSNSFGWKMIKSLGRKLKADISVSGDSGTSVQLKLARYKLVV